MQAIRATAAAARNARPWNKAQIREIHPRDVELLSPDPALAPFKNTKTTAKKMQMFGDATIVVLGLGFLYEIHYRWDKKCKEAKSS